MKTAIVIGSTGLVGSQLIKQLLENENYSEVISFVRRASGVQHPKLTEHLVDFDKPEDWKDLVKGDILFSAMGTTIKNAKTKEAQYKVDFTYQYNTAKHASENGIPIYVLISSAGANPNSNNFYMSMKGKLEQAVGELSFEKRQILRPGQLEGERTEYRVMEEMGLKVMKFLNTLGLLKRYRPIKDYQVANAMINVAEKSDSGIYTLEQVFEL